MKIIRYQKSYTKLLLQNNMLSVISLIGIFGVVVFVIIFPFLNESMRSFKWAVASVLLVPFLLILRRIIYSNFNNLMSSAAGAEAEDMIIKTLSDNLNDDYICIVNYTIPNTKIGDYDAIILGPKGIIIIETKAWKGDLKIQGRNILRKRGDDWQVYKIDPFRQIDIEKRNIIRFLKKKNNNTKIYPIIAIFEGKVNKVSGYPGAFVIEYDSLAEYIKKMPDQRCQAKELLKLFG